MPRRERTPTGRADAKAADLKLTEMVTMGLEALTLRFPAGRMQLNYALSLVREVKGMIDTPAPAPRVREKKTPAAAPATPPPAATTETNVRQMPAKGGLSL